MRAISVICALAAVLLGVVGPAGRGLRGRLGVAPPRRRGTRRRGLVAGLASLVTAGVWVVGLMLAGGRGVVIATAATMVVGAAAFVLRQRATMTSAVRAEVEVAHACDVLASHLQVGLVPSEALAVASQDCPVLVEARQVHDVGGDATSVWRGQAEQPGHGGLLELARAWQVSNQTGAPLSATLTQVAAALSAEDALRAVVAGELASPRATSKVMAALPVCGLGLGYLLGGNPIQWLLAGPIGWVCVLTGVLLACLGVLWIELLARQAAAQG